MRWNAPLLVIALACIAGCGAPARHAAPDAGHTAVPITAAAAVSQATARIIGSTDPDRISALAAHDGDIWIAADGYILRSDDFGAHWRRLARIADGVASLSVSSASEGWAATPGGLLRTRDGGASWNATAPIDSILRVRFVDATEGWILTAGGAMRRTADGGATWTALPNPCGPAAGRIPATRTFFSFVTADTGWTLCPELASEGFEAKDLYRTTDGGATWRLYSYVHWGSGPPSAHPLPGSYVSDLFFLDERHGWMTGHWGGIEETDDGAATWHPHPTAPEVPGDAIAFASPSRGVALRCCYSNASVDVTSDAGRAWTTVYALRLDAPALPSPVPGRDVPLIIGGRTTTWSALLPDDRVYAAVVRPDIVLAVTTPCHPLALSMPEKPAGPALAGQLQCEASRLLASLDGGRTWTAYTAPHATPADLFQRNGVIELSTGDALYAVEEVERRGAVSCPRSSRTADGRHPPPPPQSRIVPA
jgi:photosystem II stability/assembly factor-like uncharacterized protein